MNKFSKFLASERYFGISIGIFIGAVFFSSSWFVIVLTGAALALVIASNKLQVEKDV